MKVIKTFKNIDLIEVSHGKFCVRKRYKSWLLRRDKVTYFCTQYNGTDFTHDNLAAAVTVDEYERCEYIFNCNAIALGAV